MKIAFCVPYLYKWDNFSNVKAHYEYLKEEGHVVGLCNIHIRPKINYSEFDQIWLMGSGTAISKELFDSINIPVISFGWSDPNLFNEDHFNNCDIYFTNDLRTSRQYKKAIYYQTSCDKRNHKNLNLPKITDILVYGCGDHKFVQNRNEVVNRLRDIGFDIKVFGRGWDKHEHTFGHISGIDFIREINQANLVLDITNGQTAWAHRILEASACGTPVITYDREDTRLMFKENSEILFYKDFESLASKLCYYLGYCGLRGIGNQAQKRCYEEHDISIKIHWLLNTIKDIL